MNESKQNQKLSSGTEQPVPSKLPQRWSATRKREVVLRLLRGESLDAVSREVGVEAYRLERWRERALAGLDASLKERQQGDPVQAGLEAAYQRVGELSMENELLRAKIARLEGGVSFRRARSRR